MAKRQCAIASHLKVAYGSWTWTEENPWPPWSAVIKAPLWKEPKYEGLRGLLQKPVAKPVCEKSDTGLVSIQCARESLVESSTGKLIAESGRVELMAMRCGVPVPSIISSLPFAACVIEVPRLYTAGLHNVVAQLLLSGVPVFIAGESADVKATVAALKATVAEDMYQCDVALYNLSSKTPLYTSTSHLVSICSATAFDNRLPRYVAFTEGPMSSVMPVEIFSFLLSLVPVPERAGNWFLLGTLSVYFASMMSTRFSKDCNVVCALLGEETVVPDDFVQLIRAGITNADTCPPKSWEDVYHDLGPGFPVDCSGVRYVDEDPKEQDGEAESQPETQTPKKKPKTAPAPSPSGTQCAQATPAPSSGTVAPTGKGMNTFVNHFSPSQGGNTQSQNSATAKSGPAAPAKQPANTGAKKPRASGLRKR